MRMNMLWMPCQIMSWLNHHVTNFYQVYVYKIGVNPGENKDICSKSNTWVSNSIFVGNEWVI